MEKGNREVEYSEICNSVRHTLDSRASTFSFAIGMNAALLAVVMQYISQGLAKISVSIFALITTFIFSRVDRRTICALDQFVKQGRKLEETLGFSFFSEVFSTFEKSKIRTRTYYAVLYWIIIFLWFFQIGLIIAKIG